MLKNWDLTKTSHIHSPEDIPEKVGYRLLLVSSVSHRGCYGCGGGVVQTKQVPDQQVPAPHLLLGGSRLLCLVIHVVILLAGEFRY